MPGGRPSKPTEQKREQGTLRDHRERGKAPEAPPLPALPPAPAGVRNEPGALLYWNEYGTNLVERRYLAATDVGILKTLCIREAMRDRFLKAVADEGDTVTTPKGMVQRNPNLVSLAECDAIILRCYDQLGMTPSARVRVRGAVPAPQEDDPFAKFRVFPGAKGS